VAEQLEGRGGTRRGPHRPAPWRRRIAASGLPPGRSRDRRGGRDLHLGARRRPPLPALRRRRLDRSYLAFPSAAAPAYLVEDSPEAIALFARSVLVAPPRARFALAIEVVLLVVRRLRLWWLVRLLAPGRLAVGSKL
jgi:hypothetical protein